MPPPEWESGNRDCIYCWHWLWHCAALGARGCQGELPVAVPPVSCLQADSCCHVNTASLSLPFDANAPQSDDACMPCPASWQAKQAAVPYRSSSPHASRTMWMSRWPLCGGRASSARAVPAMWATGEVLAPVWVRSRPTHAGWRACISPVCMVTVVCPWWHTQARSVRHDRSREEP